MSGTFRRGTPARLPQAVLDAVTRVILTVHQAEPLLLLADALEDASTEAAAAGLNGDGLWDLAACARHQAIVSPPLINPELPQ
jgi:hypothetical protein